MRTYQNDSTLDFQYQLAENDVINFWCELHKGDYKELSSLALLLLIISPTSVVCESVMNYVKNEFRSAYTGKPQCLYGSCHDMIEHTILFHSLNYCH